MKIVLVHDYLNEYGGAERVLQTLSNMFPQAPIYTAFATKDSSAWQHFNDKKIIESWLAPLLKRGKLYSPLRFLAPVIWESFDFSDFDMVISSASWYITKGIKTKSPTKHICYCHTPPRYLYGLPTSIEWQRYFPIRIYAKLVNGFLKKYDYQAAQRPDSFIVNSANVQDRVKRFYHRDSIIVYPPIKVREIMRVTKNIKKQDFYLIVSRVVGSKGIDLAMQAARQLKFSLKIVGETAGLAWEEDKLSKLKADNIEFLGRVPDAKLWQLYGQAKAFLALAQDEDFGMTLVEAQAAGTPVIAYYGGGYKETVIDGKTGEFFRDYSISSLVKAIKRFDKKHYSKKDLQNNALRFDEEIFKNKITQLTLA
ncbi:glycosyltransferase family 4 protein [Candidatus Beckwithbacteria bacterium]|nr:glycosyltransferase family 4 protein [Candidatus Beckwithbacteria bacterium]